MEIIVDIVNWKKVNVKKIATVIKESRTLNAVQEEMTINQIEETIKKYFMNDNVVFVCAKNDKILIGFLVLYASNDEFVEINPGMTLGGHPVIIKTADWHQTNEKLLNKAINWAIKHEVGIIELTIPWEKEVDQELYENYITFYKAIGLEEKLKYVEMECVLAQLSIDENLFPESIHFESISELDEDELYQCYIATFEEGDAKFFSYQGENEKFEYFRDLGYPNDFDSLTSIALKIDNELIGFSIVLPISEKHYHISCICVSPHFKGKGYGKMMLFYIQNKLKTQKAQKITLGTEPVMRAFNLYQKYGFEVTDGFIIFRGELKKSKL